MQVGHITEVHSSEVSLLVCQDVAAFLKVRRAEPGRGIMFHRIGPGEVVKPGPGGDIPEDSAPVHVTCFRRSVDVIDELVVIGGIIGGYVAMPFREIPASVEEILIILPDSNDGGSLLYESGSLVPAQADLVEPFAGGIIATRLVEPVSIENSEVNLVTHLGVKSVEDREGGAHAVASTFRIIAAGEFEAEVKQALRVACSVPVILRPRHSAERPLQLMICDPVVIPGIGGEVIDSEEASVVMFRPSGGEGSGEVELSGLLSVKDGDFALSLGANPEAHGVWRGSSKERSFSDADGGGSRILGEGLPAEVEAENQRGRQKKFHRDAMQEEGEPCFW